MFDNIFVDGEQLISEEVGNDEVTWTQGEQIDGDENLAGTPVAGVQEQQRSGNEGEESVDIDLSFEQLLTAGENDWEKELAALP